MFKKEIEETKQALENTFKIYAKMKDLENEYKSLENKLYIDFYTRAYSSTIYNEAIKKLRCAVINTTGIKDIHFRECGYSEKPEEILNEAYNKVSEITEKTILEKLKNMLNTRYNYEKNNRYTIKGDTIELQIDFKHYTKLILNSLNIIINGVIETLEITEKCKEVLKTENTFVYRNIQITSYKNGKTKLVFADSELKNKFVKELINA